jgi:hypothetical protein
MFHATRLLLLGVLLPVAAAAQQPETRKIPDDSVEIVTTGCLKGRVFTATMPAEESLRRGPNVTGRNFRLTGPREVMKVVKSHDGDLVQITGLVRKADLRDYAPGARIGNTRVVIGAPRSGDPMQSARAPIDQGVAIMDATAVRPLDDRCPIVRR